MNNPIDRFLNGITMYRLMLYGLAVLLLISAVISTGGSLSFGALPLAGSVFGLLVICYFSNRLFAFAYGVPTNAESALITALILACILPPPTNLLGAIGVGLAGLLAMTSKYLVAFGRRHIFNPVASGAVVVGLLGLVQPDWWIGSAKLLPFTLLFSLLVLRKIRRFELAVMFAGLALLVLLWLGHVDGVRVSQSLTLALASSPLIFFAGVMLTEPLTAPSKPINLMLYGGLIGLLFASHWQLGPLYSTPELALVAGNLYAFVSGRKRKPLVRFKSATQLSPGIYDVILTPSEPLGFVAGQYVDLTLEHPSVDGRGNRRTFSLASAPSESDLHFGIRVPDGASSFKRALIAAKPGAIVGIGTVGGDFLLPADRSVKLAFLAGGIGITPFRSMAAGLNDVRDAILLYAVASSDAATYADVFKQAQAYGLKTVLTLGSQAIVPKGWGGRSGRIDQKMLMEEIPDFAERTFYISGSPPFVDACRSAVIALGVRSSKIMTDYFPGY